LGDEYDRHHAHVIDQINRGEAIASIVESWHEGQESFCKKHKRYLLYD